MWTFLGERFAGWPDIVAVFGFNLLFHSTLLIGIGLAGMLFLKMRRKGSAAQSLLLRLCLLSVLVLPFALPVFSAIGISGWQMRVPLKRNPDVSVSVQSVPDAHRTLRNEDSRRAGVSGQSLPSRGNDFVEYPSVASQKRSISPKQQSPVPETKRTVPVSRVSSDRGISLPSVVASGLPGELLHSLMLPFCLLWMGFSLFFTLRAGAILLYISNIRRVSCPAHPKHIALAGEVAGELGMDAPPVLRNPYVKSALLIGILRPAILLPDRGNEIPMAVREVFLHEFAHLARRDPLWLHLCILAKILIPFQPLLWLLSRRIEELSDYACDDFVVHHTGSQRSYATLLLDLARLSQPRGIEVSAGSGMISSPFPLVRRIERILNNSYSRYVTVSANEVMSFSVLFLCAVTLSGFIGFRGENADGIAYAAEHHSRQGENSLRNIVSHLHIPLTASAAALSMEKRHTDASSPETTAPHPSVPERLDSGQKPYIRPNSEKMEGAPDEALSTFDARLADDVVTDARSARAAELESIAFPVSPVSTNISVSSRVPEIGIADSTAVVSGKKSDERAKMIACQDSLQVAGWPELSGAIAVDDGETVEVPTGQLKIDTPDNCGEVLRESLEQGQENPVWSPTGKIIAFTGSNGLGVWAMPVKGGRPVLLRDNSGDPVYAMSSSSGKTTRVLGFRSNGKYVTIVSFHKKPSAAGAAKTAETEGVTLIPSIETINLVTGEQQVTVENASDGCWSPDNRYFVYVDGDYYGIGVVDTATGEQVKVSSTGKTPCVTPDGKNIIYVDWDMNSTDQLFRVPIQGGKPEQLTFEDYWWNPKCSPDGEWVLCSGMSRLDFGSYSRIRAYNLHFHKVFDVLVGKGQTANFGSWSPNGRQFCYTVFNGIVKNGTHIRTSSIQIGDFTLKSMANTTVESSTPLTFKLIGNYPNPFNPSTTIKFSLPAEGFVELTVYAINGQKICELAGKRFSSGEHAVVWNGRDQQGNPVSSGVYISRLKMEGKVETRRMTLVK